MNKCELKAEIARHGDRQKDLAYALGISPSVLSSRINGITPFTHPETEAIAARYKMSAKDIMRVFFDK